VLFFPDRPYLARVSRILASCDEIEQLGGQAFDSLTGIDWCRIDGEAERRDDCRLFDAKSPAFLGRKGDLLWTDVISPLHRYIRRAGVRGGALRPLFDYAGDISRRWLDNCEQALLP